MNADQIALLEYIQGLNKKTAEWVAANPGSWASGIIEEIPFWAEQGIHTVDQFIHSSLCTDAYELHKDRYGFKTNYSELTRMTIPELDALVARLGKMESSY